MSSIIGSAVDTIAGKFNIAIVGAGNAGCAHAFKLSESGHRVTLIKTSNTMHDENFEAILSQGGIWAEDHTQNDKKSFQALHKITRDIKDGLSDADVILIMTQSLQHEQVAEYIAPHIPAGLKLLLVIPGNLGSLFFRDRVPENAIVGEGESTPFDARIVSSGVVNILFKNVRNKLGFLPASKNDEGMRLAKQILNSYDTPRTNIVESALHNPNLVVHTVGVIMSAARIEYTGGEFWMYREGFTPSIWNLIDQLDSEKNSVITAFGGIASAYVDECKYRNESDLSKNSLEVFKSYADDGGPKGPSSIHSRYLYEDVQNGLCLMSSLAQKAGVKTPVCDSLITIASCLVNKDFYRGARNVNRLGWKDLGLNEIVKFLS